MNGNGIARGATRPDDGPGSMDRKTSVVGVWTGFLETKAGRWVKERTGFVENLGAGSPTGSRALIFWTLALPSPIMFLLLFAAPGAAFTAYLLLAAALGLLFIMFWQAYNGSEQQDRDAFDTNWTLMPAPGGKASAREGWACASANAMAGMRGSPPRRRCMCLPPPGPARPPASSSR